MNIILFDTAERRRLFPITATRAVADIRMGILTIKERWEKLIKAEAFVLTDQYLQPLYKDIPSNDCVFIDATVLPSFDLVEKITNLNYDESISDENGLIAIKTSFNTLPSVQQMTTLSKKSYSISAANRLLFPHQIFLRNEEMIRFDYNLLSKKRISHSHNDSVNVISAPNIFIEEGAQIDYSTLNATLGPIYIGKNATVMEGCFIRGPFALCEGAVLKMGSKIYGATTIGPFCIAGGEIKNSVMTGYSNKGHDGYLGDSVIGEWCNLGAGTSNSNVKNTGGTIRLWNYYENAFFPSGNKCGMIMGDYSKTAINTSVNTATVIGICCNVFGAGLTSKFIKDFSWGVKGDKQYEYEKALQDILNWKKMKNKTVSDPETNALKHIFENSNN